MSIIMYVIATIAIFCLLFFYSKIMFDLKKRNEMLLKNKTNIAYVKANTNIIIRNVNNEQITSALFEYIKNGGQEVICDAGDVDFVLSFYHTKGIPGVVKVNTNIQEQKVSFKLEAGKAYVIYYSNDNGFYVEEPEKMKWATKLYKDFKNKFVTLISK